MAALLAVAVDRLWRWTRNLVTIVHEAGHALTAVLSGLTLSTGRPSGPGMVATAAAGYLAPSLAGLVGVVLLAFDQVTVMLWAATGLLLAMLVMVRNVYGAVSLVVTGAVVVAVSVLAGADVQAGFAYAVTWFLLLAGVRPVGELWRERRRWRGRAPTDADQLARLTRIPGGVWVGLFGLGTLAALAAGGWVLLT